MCLFIQQYDPITIPIKGNTQIRFFSNNRGLQLLQMGSMGWIGCMVWEMAIRLTTQCNDFTAQILQDLFGTVSC